MADIVNTTNLTTSWSSEVEIPAGTRFIEIWGVDDVTAAAPARAAIWARLYDGTDYAPIEIGTAGTYEKEFAQPSQVQQGQWTVAFKAAATVDAVMVCT